MKVLKWIIIVIVALIAVFLIYSATQPNKLVLKESISIDAPQEQVFKEIVNFKNWGEWSAWDKLDPDMKQEYSETMGEIGSYNKWWSKNPMVGNGMQEVVEITKSEYVKTAMEFEGWDATNYSEFILTEEKGGTKVVWTYLGSETPFYMNFMNTLMEPTLKESYTKSLADLKTYIEAMPKEIPNPMGLQVIEVEGKPIVSILDSTDAAGISAKLTELYTELSIFLETAQNAESAGMPLAIYHNYSPEKVVLEAAIPFQGEASAAGRVEVKNTPAGTVIKGIHYGDYSASEDMHNSIAKYADIKNLSISGSPWEIYANDPSEVDSADIETHIYYPVQ